MPNILHMISTNRSTFVTKMDKLTNAKFILPNDNRFTHVQVIPDRIKPNLQNIFFNLMTQVNVRFNSETNWYTAAAICPASKDDASKLTSWISKNY